MTEDDTTATLREAGDLAAPWPAEEVSRGVKLLRANGCSDGGDQVYAKTKAVLNEIRDERTQDLIRIEDTGERVRVIRCGLCRRAAEVSRYQTAPTPSLVRGG